MKTTTVNLSGKTLQMRFCCTTDFITSKCKGACCRRSGKSAIIPVTQDEADRLTNAYGITVENGCIQAVNKYCPFQDKTTGFCSLHLKDEKPLGCILGPLMLTSRNTLVVRNRAMLFACHKPLDAPPAWVAFKSGLIKLFGEDGYTKIEDHFKTGTTENLEMEMDTALLDTWKSLTDKQKKHA